MKDLANEVLNKLIDNELDSTEIDELYNLIKNEEELQKALVVLEDKLKKVIDIKKK